MAAVPHVAPLRLFPRQHIHADEYAGSSATLGVPFLQNSPGFTALYPNARMVVEMAFGAVISADPTTWSWTDVTTDVRQSDGQTINIAPFGRSDVTTQTQPAACGFQLDNNSGDYSRGPQSRRYPNIHQNIPLRVWVTLTGATIDMRIQFQGEAWSLKPSWNKKGNIAVVNVRAGGKLRQLTQGAVALRSPLYRAVHTVTPVAAWPMEDGPDATSLASSVVGGTPMRIINPGVTTGVVDTTLPGAAAVIKLAPDVVALPGAGQVMATIPAYTNTGYLGIRIWHRVSDGSGAAIVGGDTVAFSMSGAGSLYHGTIDLWGPGFTPGVQFSMLGTLAHAAPVTSVGIDPTDGDWHEIFVALTQSGADVLVRVYLDGQLGATDTFTSETLDPINSIWINGDMQTASGWRLSAAGLALYTDPAAVSEYAAGFGYQGETATDRLTRLSAEEGVPIDITGTSTARMGPQSVATFVNLLRECEAVDLGVLGDGRGPGPYYITRSARYSQLVTVALDATAGELAEAPDPEDDDQNLRNSYKVTRKGGSSDSYVDRTGPLGTLAVGKYDSTPGSDLNLSDDSTLYQIAAWLVGLGTVEGYRYPTLAIDLRTIPATAPAWASLRPGGRLTVTGIASVSPQHPVDVVDLLVEGWTQRLSPFVWDAVLNCSPAQPWDVGVTGDSLRLEMAGQMIDSDLAPGATSLSLVTAAGHQLFTTTATWPADFPMDVKLGGWRITVTAAVGASSPQTLTCDPTPNSAPIPAGTPVTLWRPAVLAL